MSELPKGWVETPLFTIGEIVTGNTPSRKQLDYYGTDIPWAKPSDLMVKEPLVKTDEYLSKAGGDVARVLPKGSVLVSCIGNLGKVAIAGTELATNQQINSVVFNESIVLPRYGYYFLHTAKPWMDANASATTIAILNKGRFGQLPVRIAPLNEQKRIVAKLDELLPKVEACKQRLEKIPTILKRFRQSVLADAVSGKLTGEWRKGRHSCIVTDDLIAHIHDERRQLRKNKKGCAAISSGVPLVDAPSEWRYLTLDELSEVVTDGDHNPPKRVANGIPHLTAKHVRNWKLLPEGASFISEEDYLRVCKRYEPRAGDVILTCVGTIGRTAVVEQEFTRFSADRNLAVIRLLSSAMLPEFLQLILNTSQYQHSMGTASGSSAQPHIYLDEIRNLVVPLPTLDEQREIVSLAKALLGKLERLERHLLSAKAMTLRVTDALLGMAFSGALLPQDPADEPAPILLERIKSSAPSPKQKKAPSGKRNAAKEPHSLSA